MDYPFQEDLRLSELDLRYIGNLKNPKQKKIEKENEPEDMVKLLLRCKQQGQELDPKKTNHARDLLEPFGYDARERSLIVKKVNEGSPHAVDLIEKNKIQLIINTTSGVKSISDSFSIRRSAIRSKIPYFTTISAAKIAVTGLNLIKKTEFSVNPLQELYK